MPEASQRATTIHCFALPQGQPVWVPEVPPPDTQASTLGPGKHTGAGLCLATSLYVAVHSRNHAHTSRQGGFIRLFWLGTRPGMVTSRVCYVNKEVRDVLTLHSPRATPFTVVHTVGYFCPQFVLCLYPHTAHFWFTPGNWQHWNQLHGWCSDWQV